MQNRLFVVRDMEIDSSSSSEEECLAVIAVALTYRQRKHRVWVRNAFKKKISAATSLLKNSLLEIDKCTFERNVHTCNEKDLQSF